MNSIDQNQKEQNHKDLSDLDSVKKIKEIAKDHTCFFYTSEGSKGSARPMTVQKVDDEGNLWFLSAADSRQNKEIEQNSAVQLYFQQSQHSKFMHLYGHASISQDKKIIQELWTPFLKTWFTEGENDPRISVIKFTANEGYYWDVKHGNFIAGIKMLIGATIGKTMDDSIQGEIKNDFAHKNHISHG